MKQFSVWALAFILRDVTFLLIESHSDCMYAVRLLHCDRVISERHLRVIEMMVGQYSGSFPRVRIPFPEICPGPDY